MNVYKVALLLTNEAKNQQLLVNNTQYVSNFTSVFLHIYNILVHALFQKF